jgi:hypothetical protein
MSHQGQDNEDSELDEHLGRIAIETLPQYHPSYKDIDSGDLVIQTNDNILFRVYSYYLKAAR